MDDPFSRTQLADLVYQLLAVPAYGWSKDASLLARTLGFRYEKAMRDQLFGDHRLSIDSQLAASKKMVAILAGHIVVERRLWPGPGHRIMSSAVLAEDPRPLGARLPIQGFVSVGRSGVKLRMGAPAVLPEKRSMPTFAEMWRKIGGVLGRPE